MFACSFVPSFRRFAGLACGAAAAALLMVLPAPRLRGQTAVTPPPVAMSSAGQPPAADAAQVKTWYFGATTRLLAGYTDNVQWSAVAPRGRGFLQGELEALAIRPLRGNWETRLIVSSEVRRYGDALPESTGEQRWIGRGELAYVPRKAMRWSLIGQGFYQDQVYDLSADAGRRMVARMRVSGAVGIFQPRFALPGGWEVEPTLQVRETDYFDFAEDFTETRGGMRVRWKGGERFQVQAAVHEHRRDFRDRVNYTAGGRALPGTKLHFDQATAETRLSWTWRRPQQSWAIAPGYYHTANRDVASGFFNYNHDRMRLDFTWESPRWRIDADISTGRYKFLGQTVGMGIAPPARKRNDRGANAALEYGLGGRWKALLRELGGIPLE